MALTRIHEKPNAVPVNDSVFILSTQVNGVWYDQKVTWEQLKGLIGALDNLENYYKKSETYTKTEVNQLIAQIPTFSIEIVQQLPTTDISTTTIYLVPKQTAGTLDYYDEFINLDGTTSGWEWLGKTEIDLSNYYTKAETEAYVKGDGADYIAATKTFSSLTTTAKAIIDAINEVKQTAVAAQADATQALADASAAQGTANSASSAASSAQGTADNALTAAGNAANAASAAQGTANTALTTAQSMAVSVTNTLTPGDTTKKVADVTQNGTTTPIYADDAEKVIVALTDEQTTATGNPVTLTTVQSGGAKSALVTFAPKQDLHGYDHPWAGGNGKNKLNFIRASSTIQGITFDIDTNGVVTANGTSTGVATFFKDVDLIFDTDCYLSGSPNVQGCQIDVNGGLYPDSGNGSTIPSNTQITSVRIRIGSGVTVNNVKFYPMIRTSGDATFEPYSNICPISGYVALTLTVSDGDEQEDEYTATFPSTIMGGSYDFVSGKITETKGNIIFDGSADENWSIQSINSYGIVNFKIEGNNIESNKNDSLCNMFAQQNSLISVTQDEGFLVTAANTIYLRIKSTTISTVEELRTWLSNNNVQIVYPFTTPIEITLPPADVNLLKGSNTVWTDGDTVQVKYSELPNGNLGAVIEYIKKLEARVKALES